MSKFHFDETAVEEAIKGLDQILEEIHGVSKPLNDAMLTANRSTGFNIENSVNRISVELGTGLPRDVEQLQRSRDTLKQISESVSYNVKLASMVNTNGGFVDSVVSGMLGKEFDAYKGFSSKFANEKANASTGIILGLGFGDLFEDTISGFIKTGKLDGVDRKNCKNALIAVLDSLTKEDPYLYEKYCEGMNDSLKGALKELKMAKTITSDLMKKMPKEIQNFFNDISKIADFQKLSGELVAGWFEDYTESMKYLETLSLMANEGSNDKMTMEVISELKDEYSNKFIQTVKTVIDFGVDKASGQLIDNITNIIPNGKLTYKILDMTADLTAKFTGFDGVASSYHTFSGLVTLESHINAEYNKAAQEILNGNLSDESVNNYRNLFELKKSVKINQLNAMIAMEKAECDVATNPLNHGDMFNKNRRKEVMASYDKKIKEYESLKNEISEIKCLI